MRLWIKNPLGIVAEGAGGGVVVDGAVIVELVAAGGAPASSVDEVFDASNHVVLPGLINTHHHFYQTLTRAHPAAIDRELFPWLTALYPLWARLTPGDLRLAIRAALTELLLSGCTTAADHHYLYPKSAELAARFDAPLHTHLAETKDEDAYCLEVYGKRPLDLLEETGWMRPKTWLAHGIHFSCEECERLGKAGVGVCHCPTSNGVLASGFCRTRELEAAGAPLGLGVDGSASNDGSNLMEELRHALLINRLRYASATAVTAKDVIRWATEGSARCLGRSDIGRIAPGMQADFALYRLDELRFSGAHDPVAALVLCGASRADRVMVAGRWRVIDGAVPGFDLAALRRAHGAASRRYA